jgi:hypothetical protein
MNPINSLLNKKYKIATIDEWSILAKSFYIEIETLLIGFMNNITTNIHSIEKGQHI